MISPHPKFFVSNDGKEKLSLGKTQLQAGIDAGKHSADSLAWTEGMNEWLPLGDPYWEKHGIRFKGDSDNSLQPGSTFGKHRIVRLLGRGGMGEVYEVEHELTGKRHALKLLSTDVMEVSGALERFEREAKVMARLEHPGIVRVDDSGDTDGRHWLRMELMPGREVEGKRVITLEEFVEAKGGRLPESEVKKLTVEMLEALGHAHGQGLVHRDLKPANVLLDGERLKIADFGLVNAAGAEWMDTQVRSTVINQDEEDTLIDDGSGTGSRSRAIMGTYSFMSPEQKKGQSADARSDLYAVGLMVFRMLTGVETPGLKLPSRIIGGLNSAWDDWLVRSLEEKPTDRFPNAGEMKDALSFKERTVPPATGAKPQVAQPKAPVRKAPVVRSLSANQGVRTGRSYPPRSKPAKRKVWPYLLGILALPVVWLFAIAIFGVLDEDDGSVPSSGGIDQSKSFTVSSIGMDMIWVNPGSFRMGESYDDYGVTLTEGFYLGKYEVTQGQWERVMGSNPSKFKGSSRPVEFVSWEDAVAFCRKLTEVERLAGRLTAGMAYQLPTEAQWEYACRAGTTTAYSWGNSISSANASYDRKFSDGTTPVGEYPANPWGFHDMHGNVWEWCADWYGNYPRDAVRDPVGPETGSIRVNRGGSWSNDGSSLRSAKRYYDSPSYRYDSLGFRVGFLPSK